MSYQSGGIRVGAERLRYGPEAHSEALLRDSAWHVDKSATRMPRLNAARALVRRCARLVRPSVPSLKDYEKEGIVLAHVLFLN